jgi:hypothetical protein
MKKNKEDDSYNVPGLTTGKYNVSTGENGEPILVNSLGGAAFYDPNKDARTLSYNSKIPLEVFRRVAKGEDIPEAAHKQYQDSQKPAPHGAYEADHEDHLKHMNHANGVVLPSPRSSASPQPDSLETATENSSARSQSFWIPLSFALLAVSAGLLLWRILRKGD